MPARGDRAARHSRQSTYMKIAGSVAFVSGTNRGIGRAYVEALLARGAKKIYATARKSASVIDLAKANPGRIELLALEVTDEKSVAAAADSRFNCSSRLS